MKTYMNIGDRCTLGYARIKCTDADGLTTARCSMCYIKATEGYRHLCHFLACTPHERADKLFVYFERVGTRKRVIRRQFTPKNI